MFIRWMPGGHRETEGRTRRRRPRRVLFQCHVTVSYLSQSATPLLEVPNLHHLVFPLAILPNLYQFLPLRSNPRLKPTHRHRPRFSGIVSIDSMGRPSFSVAADPLESRHDEQYLGIKATSAFEYHAKSPQNKYERACT
jgi:hypothetical protein